MRRKIVKQREQEVYKAEELKRNLLEGIAIVLLICLTAGLLFGIGYLYFNR